eukprot:1458371-Rhodomonas_salina.1
MSSLHTPHSTLPGVAMWIAACACGHALGEMSAVRGSVRECEGSGQRRRCEQQREREEEGERKSGADQRETTRKTEREKEPRREARQMGGRKGGENEAYREKG